jgi:hypothetical protein
VRAELDTEATRLLLDMLGVRNTPTGPDRLLDRLRSLSTVEIPPIYEVEKWCRRLDQILSRCSTEEFQEIQGAFKKEKIILTAETEWVFATEVFLNADEEDAPGAAVIHPTIRDLSIWRKIGVADRPTAELSLKWLSSIQSYKKLSKDELRRVRGLLPRYAKRIWLECGHWLNLDGDWVPTKDLSYKLTMNTLIPWTNLFNPIKQKIADLQKLTIEICAQSPFSDLPTLAEVIENRFDHKVFASEKTLEKPWLKKLGSALVRVELENEIENNYIRELGYRLAHTMWQIVAILESTPYIEGIPSGTPRNIDVLWNDKTLYVKNGSIAKMAKAIAQELGRSFGRTDIADAIKLCFERDPSFVTEYMEENFKLLPPEKIESKGQAEFLANRTNNSATKSKDSVIEGAEASGTKPTIDLNSENLSNIQEVDTLGVVDGILLDDQNSELDSEEDYSAEEDASRRRKTIQRSQKKIQLIERYANANGFTKDNTEDRYYRKDGSWIERASGNIFPWERYSASGQLLQCFWVKDHCIEREPLQLEAGVWNLCVNEPEKYTLILTSMDGTPIEYSGKRICDLKNSGRLSLFPASYRLVYDPDSI